MVKHIQTNLSLEDGDLKCPKCTNKDLHHTIMKDKLKS